MESKKINVKQGMKLVISNLISRLEKFKVPNGCTDPIGKTRVFLSVSVLLFFFFLIKLSGHKYLNSLD